MSTSKLIFPKGLSTTLDLLRTAAASGVLLSHINKIFIYRLYDSPSSLTNNLPFFSTILGYYCVLIFFIISGFLITNSLLKNYQANQEIHIDTFIKSRLLRLYPGIIMGLVFSVYVVGIIFSANLHGKHSYLLAGELYSARTAASINIIDYLGCLLFMQYIFYFGVPVVNGPLWTLSYEFWIYIMALCAALIITHHKNKLITNILATSYLLLIPVLAYLPARVIVFWFAWLCGGALLWCYQQQFYHNNKLRLLALSTTIVSSLTTVLIISHTSMASLDIYSKQADISHIAIPILVTLAISGAFISSKFFVTINYSKHITNIAKTARYSYTLYVIHFPILLLVLSLLGSYLQQFTTATLLLLVIVLFFTVHVIALLCSYWVEPRKKLLQSETRS